MATKQDYYSVLEVERGASKADIKKAYLKLARKYHPDVNKEAGAEARFKEVKEAYEILHDDDKRAAYDRFGHAAVNGNGGPGGFGGSPFGAGSPFEDLFDSFFGGGRQQGPPRGADLQTQVSIDFEEAIFGAQREINVTRLQTCPTCNGSRAEPGTQPVTCVACAGAGQVRRVQNTILGQFVTASPCERCRGEGVVIPSPCKNCNGEGRVRQTNQLNVTIPPGIEDDATLRLSGQGEASPAGGQPGNLYVKVRVAPHPLFSRQGKTIHSEIAVTFPQAALGQELEIDTIDGPVAFKLPAGTQSGQQFRLRGKGVPDMRGGDRGDQIVTVRVITPRDLSPEQRDLLERLAESLGDEVPSGAQKGLFDRIKDVLGRWLAPAEQTTAPGPV
jgi:molecular chaperone DnaJ